MREVLGNLWDYYGRDPYIVLITTNGTVRANGKNVMGKGCANEARLKIPGIEKLIGAHITSFGNKVAITDTGYGSFPVKKNWWDNADMNLISQSANQLRKFAESETFRNNIFVLPRPGCGSGNLVWARVKPLLESCKLPDNVWIISKSIA